MAAWAGFDDRRELATELGVAGAFVAVAATLAAAVPADRALHPGTACFLVALLVVALNVEFDVGEGHTRPVQLVFVPMLFLLPVTAVPLAVAIAQLLSRLPGVVTGRRRAGHLVLCLSDGWFAVGPAVVLTVVGADEPTWALGLASAAALAAQVACDLVASAVRLRGLDIALRTHLGGLGWVWLVDALLTPIGLLAAIVGRTQPAAVALVMPLAGLLVIFARERRGRIEAALAASRIAAAGERRLQAVVQHASDLILLLERDGTIRTITGCVDVLGAAAERAHGASLLDLVHPADRVAASTFLVSAMATAPGEAHRGEWRLGDADGWRHVETVAANLLADERVDALVLTVRDMHERKAFEEQLRHRAFHDQLTGLPNRALFLDRIEHALARGRRTDRQVAVAFLDVDDLKAINDRLGHAGGDALLAGFAARLRQCVRGADTAARLGGDEFAVLLEDVSGPNEAVQAAERMMAACFEPIAVEPEPIVVTPSVGIALSAAGDGTADEVLRMADLAMYAAKRQGKGRWELYDPSMEQALAPGEGARRPTWAIRSDEQRQEVLSLLDRPDELAIAYQPIVDMRTGGVVAYEALARFSSAAPKAPDAWFAQAHRCGLGFELEALAIRRALAGPPRPPGVLLSLNVSPSALTSAQVQGALPADLTGLIVEVTEHELVAGHDEVADALRDVRGRGARIAVDDAGSGYAGLKHIARVRPDVIKLDRSLVDGVHGDADKAALIESFVRYARRLGVNVCAEGIETLEDLQRLADLDILYGQGYLIARPGAPWAPIPVAVAEACRAAARAVLLADTEGASPEASLERVVAGFANVTSAHELSRVLQRLGAELHASAAVVWARSRGVWTAAAAHGIDPEAIAPPAIAAVGARAVLQTLAADPTTAAPDMRRLRAAGARAALVVPIAGRGRVVGALELLAADDSGWARLDIRHARIAAHAVGAALDRLRPAAAAVA